MPETIGVFLLSAAGATEVTGIAGLGTLAGSTVGGISAASIVGSAAIVGVSIGLQYALSNPNTPKPESGALSLKQATPPRQRGYWFNRLGGFYMLYLPAGGNSQDVIAFHSGRIEGVQQVYLHDVAVATVPDPSHAAILNVQRVGAHQFEDNAVQLQIFYGLDDQIASTLLAGDNTSGTWTTEFPGKGIAYLAMFCNRKDTPELFTKVYPQGLPLPSVVAKCAPVWDARDPAQSRTDRSTWRAKPSPVLQLIDYLTEPDGGMGEDIDEILPPPVLAKWMEEAYLCDPLYQSAGFYQFDNPPESVIGRLLATCDGWMGEAGDGTLALTIGYYREPTKPPIKAKHIRGYSVRYGVTQEEDANQLDVSFTDPALGYVTNQAGSIRDEESISQNGVIPKPLDLPWVQMDEQAERLGERAKLRLRPTLNGTLVTTLYGMNYAGDRWIKVQFPAVRGLEDCVIEVLDRAEFDVLGDRVTFKFAVVDVDALLALQPISLNYRLDFRKTYNSQFVPLIFRMFG